MAYNPHNYGPGQYQDSNSPEFNPYNQSQHAHPTYDQTGFGTTHDSYSQQINRPVRQESQRSQKAALDMADNNLTLHKETSNIGQGSGFDRDEFNPSSSARSIRRFRFDERGALWTRGSRFACVGRFCCCTIWITLLLLASILLSLVLWVRPPNVEIGGVQTNSTGGAISKTTDGIRINLYIPITVDNPNYFDVNFKQIKADLTYPINNTDIGGGTLDNVVFTSHSTNTTINFPFAIDYNPTADPNNRVTLDLISKCTNGKSFNVDYKITVGIKIGVIVISPSHSDTFPVQCDLIKDVIGLS